MHALGEAVTGDLALRRGVGFTRRDAGIGLLDVVSCLEQPGAASITTALAWAWAQPPSSARPAAWARRLSAVRGVARDRRATDARTEIPPWGLLPHRPERARPSRYTDAEVQPWLEAALQLAPTGGLRAWTSHGRLGRLAVTGVRIREALGRTREDVDVRAGVLSVRGPTCGTSRFVPLHTSPHQVLAADTWRRGECLAGRHAVSCFVSRRGTRLDGATVRRPFDPWSRPMGVRGPRAHHGPRRHDLRPRVAVQTWVPWSRAGEEVGPRLPLVSTDLGHGPVRETWWSLTACPARMGLAVPRLEPRGEVRA
jgi:integrase